MKESSWKREFVEERWPKMEPCLTLRRMNDIIIHTMSHHHTYYVTSSYILCHIIVSGRRWNLA